MPAEQIPAEEIGKLVDGFYAKVRLDPEIGPIFNATIDDWMQPEHADVIIDKSHRIAQLFKLRSLITTTERFDG